MSDMHMRHVLDNSTYTGHVRTVYAAFALLSDDEYDSFAITVKLVPVFLTLTGLPWQSIVESMTPLVEDGCVDVIDKSGESGELSIEYRLGKPQLAIDEYYVSADLEMEILDKVAALTHDQVKDVIMATVLANLFFCFGQVEAAQAAMIDARHTLDVAELTTLDSITETDTSDLLQELRQLCDIKAVLLRYAKNWENVSQRV